MNANQLIDMVIRMVTRRLIGRGINAGIDLAANKMTKGKRSADPEQARVQDDAAKETANRTKQMMRAGRRIGRF